MKKLTVFLLCCLVLAGCAQPGTTDISESTVTSQEITEPLESIEEITAVLESIEETEDSLTRFTLYTPNENADGFTATEVEGDKLTPMEVLTDAGVLNKDIRLNQVTWEENGTLLTIDFNEAFRDQVLTQGTAGERMLIGSVVNTFLSAYGVEAVMITVEGEILESGHVVYDFPMEFFE